MNTKKIKRVAVALDENGNYEVYRFNGVESESLYIGIDELEGGFMLDTGNEPTTLVALENADAFECIEQIKAIINDESTPWEAVNEDGINHIKEWLEIWGICDFSVNYYTVTEIDSKGCGDEFDSYQGFDFDEMLKAASEVRKNDNYALELRMYKFPFNIDKDDEEEVADAALDCVGYDVLNENGDINIAKILRKATGMSQNEFAKYFEMPAGTLRNWEQGIRACPEYLIKLMVSKLKNDKMI